MKRILIVVLVALGVFVAVFRQRIFLRDPLGKVARGGVAQDGARVFINYSNDVLVEDAGHGRFILVQSWNGLPGVPQRLVCLTGLVCWTDADKAATSPLDGAGGRTRATMDAKRVSFVDDAGVGVTVDLR